ncbi:hypothetical protein [Flavobacterium sp.]|uniref:hypothetical protein n=1 Tax=Flavobacterium sp. TaxID=239 RepID=UPI00262201F1|nr:hypothetical protein [Flavobacterium sp.]
MKKYFILLVLSVILFSCKKEEKDDSYNYLYNKLNELSKRDHSVAEFTYLQNFHEIKNDISKQKRFDSLHNISLDIEKKFKSLDFSNREKVFNFRDSTIKSQKLPPILFDENDFKNLNDSVFKIKMELEILNLRESFHYMRIYDRKAPL